MGKSLRIVFMGTPEFAATALRDMVEDGYNVVGVVTVPDKPAGRGMHLQQSDVKRYALEANIPVMQPEKLRNEEFLAELKSLEADLFVVVAFRMLPEVVWAMPRLGTFNLHASLLPKYRGAAPINWAIINGEKVSGVTTFMLNHNIDEGDMLYQQEVSIEDDDTAGTLHDKLMEVGSRLIRKTIDSLADGSAQRYAQSEEGVCPAPKIFREDCVVDWTKDAKSVYDFIRGLSPYPAAATLLPLGMRGEQVSIKLFKVKILGGAPKEDCGTLSTDLKTTIKVACKDGWIAIEEMQVAGKKRMSVKDFLIGFKAEGNDKIVLL